MAFVETTMRDKRTGAEYKVKERVPNGPQGDFRIPEQQAENRYRMIMGLPSNMAFHERPVEDPFADERLQPETVMDSVALESKIRDRAFNDTRREQSFMPSREAPSWATQDFEDRGDHIVDPSGRTIDKKFGTIGPFGTDDTRMPAPPSKLTRETSAAKHATSDFVVSKAGNAPEHLVERISQKSGLQVLLTSAFRGLFGSQAADHIVSRTELSDKRQGREMPVLATAIMDSGLMKPWQPPTTKTDRPQRQDALEYAVGNRALSQLIAQKHASMPDVQDLPKAERDDLTVAIGRTILNAMTLVPEKASEKSLFEPKLKAYEELRRTIMGSIKPDILKGLVQPELLSDRRPIDMQQKPRVHGTSRTSAFGEMPERQSLEQARERPVTTRATIGNFSDVGRKHRPKQLFDMTAEGQTDGHRSEHRSDQRLEQRPFRTSVEPQFQESGRQATGAARRLETALGEREFFSQSMQL